MNKQKNWFFYGLLALILVGCTDHDWPAFQKKATPISNVTATSVRPAEILVSWDLGKASGDDMDRIGIMANYFDPITNAQMERMASAGETSLVIPNTAKVAGEYTITVHSVSSTGEFGQLYTVKATSLPMEKVYTPTDFRDIKLTVDMVSTNAQEQTEGPIENLVDGDVNNYFHTDWHYVWSELHYVEIDLKSDKYAGSDLRFGYVPRPGNSSGSPKSARIMTSTDGNSWTEVAMTNYRVPAMTGDRVDGNSFRMPAGARYIRFIPTERHDGTNLEEMLGQGDGDNFFHMGELYLSKSYGQDVYDPEEDIKDLIDAHKKKAEGADKQ